MNSPLLHQLPWLLIGTRMALAPLLIAATALDAPRMLLVGLLASALWLDIIDGVLARRLGVDTPQMRRADSRVDVVFFLAVVAGLAIAEPTIFIELSSWIAGLIVCEVMCQAISFWRFGCSTSTHSWLCKAWALMLFFSATLVFAKGVAGWPVQMTLSWGFVAYLDVLFILLISRQTPVDVPSTWHAWRRIRNQRRTTQRHPDAETSRAAG